MVQSLNSKVPNVQTNTNDPILNEWVIIERKSQFLSSPWRISFWKLPDPKRSCPNGHRSNNNSSSMCIPVGMCLISTWRFPKMGVLPNHPFKYRIFHVGVPPGNLHITTNATDWDALTGLLGSRTRRKTPRSSGSRARHLLRRPFMILDVQR